MIAALSPSIWQEGPTMEISLVSEFWTDRWQRQSYFRLPLGLNLYWPELYLNLPSASSETNLPVLTQHILFAHNANVQFRKQNGQHCGATKAEVAAKHQTVGNSAALERRDYNITKSVAWVLEQTTRS
jgi:hypothetical protein